MVIQMDRELLKITNLEVLYTVDEDVVRAVNNVSLSLRDNETLGLVGETGAGKTTLALSILGIVPDPPGKIVAGSVEYDGIKLTNLSDKQLRKYRGKEIAMIFQDPMTSLNPVLTVGDQIAEVIMLHERVSKTEAYSRAKDMLELVGIKRNRFDDYPHEFSGGMKQRVIIAIALACNPKLLIADEPTTALDVTIQMQVLDLMNKLKKERGSAMLLITHDLGVVAEACDRVAIMYAGEIVEQGKLRDVFEGDSHPYKLGLFNSLPDVDLDSKRLESIQGLAPDPTRLPEGCKFHPRCKFCSDICVKKSPEVIERSPGHFIKCWHIQQMKRGSEI